MEQKNSVGVVSVMPDWHEMSRGLMHDQTRGTCVKVDSARGAVVL